MRQKSTSVANGPCIFCLAGINFRSTCSLSSKFGTKPQVLILSLCWLRRRVNSSKEEAVVKYWEKQKHMLVKTLWEMLGRDRLSYQLMDTIISQAQNYSKSRLSHERSTSSQWWSDYLLQDSSQYLLFRVWYAQVRERNRCGQNILTEKKFSFVFQLFMKFIFKNNNVLYDRMLITFTIHSDSVFSENLS